MSRYRSNSGPVYTDLTAAASRAHGLQSRRAVYFPGTIFSHEGFGNGSTAIDARLRQTTAAAA